MSSPQKDLYDAISIVKRKIIPLAFILYFLTIWIVLTSDFAALRMNESLVLHQRILLIYLQYFCVLFDFSNSEQYWIAKKLGARKWISAIIVGWGTVTTLIFFAKDTQHILLARVFLGIFEAGFSPAWFTTGMLVPGA